VDKRAEAWPSEEPRQRRDAAWPESEVRQRRRTRWGEFREAYPRIVTAMVLGVLLLLLVDVGLLVKRSQYRRESAAARGSMTTLEKERADAFIGSKEARGALMLALVRQQSLNEKRLSLSISLEEGTMDLRREGSQLREMRVEIGPEATVGQEPGAMKVTPPLGRRHVVRVVDGSHVWHAPAWFDVHRGQGGHAAATRRGISGGLGPIAVLLDDGTALYSRPGVGPLADDAYVLPGAVRVEAADLEAIRENLGPGTPVYFF
jgi:hypothetical protein